VYIRKNHPNIGIGMRANLRAQIVYRMPKVVLFY